MKNWPKIHLKFIFLISFSLFILSTSYAQEAHSLQETLGKTAAIIEHHTCAETTKLLVASVAESRQNAFKSNDHIAGYPTQGKLQSLNKANSNQLANLLLDNNSYVNIRQRCANQFFHGIRFSRENEIVEVAIGVPCDQVVVVFKDGKETKWWGGTLGKAISTQILSLLNPSILKNNRSANNPATKK